MNSLEKKAKETFIRFWDAIIIPDAKSIKEALSLLHDDFGGYGTGQLEKFAGRKYMAWFLDEQAKQMPGGATYKIHEIKCNAVEDSVVEIFADMSFEFYTPRGSVFMDSIRATALLVNFDADMLFTHLHTSVPDQSAVDNAIIPGATEPRIYEEVTILFTDFKGFTTLTSTIPPKKLLSELNEIFANFDQIMLKNNLTKIKIIGDAYMAAAGINESDDHAIEAVAAAKQILAFLAERNSSSPIKWNTRIGIHSGRVIGGVIGSRNFYFDLYGDSVNLASAVEQAGAPDKINISAYTYGLVQGKYDCEHRGKIEIKDGRRIDMYFVN